MAKTLKELLAEKRAAEAAALKNLPPGNYTATLAGITPNGGAIVENIKPMPKKEEVAAPAVEKPMSFMEKMALKKRLAAEQAAASAKSSEEKPAPIPVSADTGMQKEIDKEQAARTGQLVEALDSHPPSTSAPVSTDTAQAYADVKAKIEQLEELEDTKLEGAMKDLKKALMANPNAVELMLDTDIGKMVIALRRITREAIVEAAKEKSNKPGRKPKDVPLSPEAIASVYDDL